MRTAEEQYEMMRDQVISKIHWGAEDQEVLEWLEERHGIAGAEADRLLAEAYRRKRQSVRSKALLMLVFSGVGVAGTGVFLYMEYAGRIVFVRRTAVVFIAFVACLGAFLRSVFQLLTGHVSGSVD